MPNLRIALAQINPCVGDVSGNAELIVDTAKRAADAGAQLAVFPEMALTGYPVEDLALRSTFVDGSRVGLAHLAVRLEQAGLGDLAVVTGFLDRAGDETSEASPRAPLPQNAVAVLHRGRVVCRQAKYHLPNYGVFDEARIFTPGTELQVVRVGGIDVALAICEDLWQQGGPVATARQAGAGLLVVSNASPYERDKDTERDQLVQRRAREAGCALAYVNCVGGQDDLVFDGDSMIADAGGTIISRGPQFEESLEVVDLELPAATEPVEGTRPEPVEGTRPEPVEGPPMSVRRHHISGAGSDPSEPITPRVLPRLPEIEEMYRALVLGLRDYLGKQGLQRVYLGLSGGIDSTLAAALACDAIGAADVYGISNPSDYSSEHSKTDAADLARRTGLNFSTVPIATIVSAFHDGMDLDGVAAENLQARIRGVIWMGASNQHRGSIVLACGNKSELAVGYSTLYGDAVGGFAPLKDVPKTWVWRLARWRNEEAVRRGETPPIPDGTISKEPSAELRPGQKDTDSLPPYEVLDQILESYVEGDHGREALLTDGFDADLVDRVIRMVDAAEYKRRQYPPGTKISGKAFGRDRRLPMTNRWREGR